MFGFPSGHWTAHRELSRAVLAVLPIVAGTDRAHAVAEKYPGMKRFQVRLDAEDDRYADVYARQDVIDLSATNETTRPRWCNPSVGDISAADPSEPVELIGVVDATSRWYRQTRHGPRSSQ